MKIVQIPFSDYIAEEHPKTQIYIHHTAGTGNGDQVYKWWAADKTKVATCVIIDRDGTVKQGFSSKFWAYHLGLGNAHFAAKKVTYRNLDKTSIGIEIIGWGWVTKKDDKFFTYVNSEVKAEDVVELDKPFRGFRYWHKYTQAQIDAVVELLKLWNEKYKIDLTYNDDIWDVTDRALKGENGVFTHCSVRPDKFDVFPQPELIEALKAL
jgi:N-acetyl-anhydromuramyl-L-alanine amidase AmpD